MKPLINPKSLTPFQLRVLSVLAEKLDGYDHEELYKRLFPVGRFNFEVDRGSSKGGPSRIQCAVNWHLGKLRWLAQRRLRRIGDDVYYGNWVIAAQGMVVLKRAREQKVVDRKGVD
jgi:hypothetical protein